MKVDAQLEALAVVYDTKAATIRSIIGELNGGNGSKRPKRHYKKHNKTAAAASTGPERNAFQRIVLPIFLTAGKPIDRVSLMTTLKEKGSENKSAGGIGSLVRFGYIKSTAKGYTLTPKGRKQAQTFVATP